MTSQIINPAVLIYLSKRFPTFVEFRNAFLGDGQGKVETVEQGVCFVLTTDGETLKALNTVKISPEYGAMLTVGQDTDGRWHILRAFTSAGVVIAERQDE